MDAEFPFLLNTGRTLYQFNAGSMTMRTPNALLHPADTLDIAPADAARLALHDGERVQIRSRYGASTLPLRITSSQKPGELFVTFHTPTSWINNVTTPHRDKIVLTPDYKRIAVTLEKLLPYEPCPRTL